MNKKRTLIGKGVPRDRYLVRVDDANDKKRLLTYNSKGRAEAGFKVSGFYGPRVPRSELEAVEIEITIRDI